MKFSRKAFAALSAAALLLAALPADAQVRRGGGWGGHGGSHWRGGGPGWVWGGVGLGIGLGLGSSLYYRGPWSPGYVVVERPPAYYYDYDDAPPGTVRAPAVRNDPPAPEPVIYPRNGQSASQTELDRQECNRWATTQDSAMRDASVFQRATLACMDGRGYTIR